MVTATSVVKRNIFELMEKPKVIDFSRSNCGEWINLFMEK